MTNFTINCFIFSSRFEDNIETCMQLQENPSVKKIYVLTSKLPAIKLPSKCDFIQTDTPYSTSSIKNIVEINDSDFLLFYIGESILKVEPKAIERYTLSLHSHPMRGVVYSNYFTEKGGEIYESEVIPHQEGSVRNDFNYGPVLCFSRQTLKQYVANATEEYRYAGLYDLLLYIERNYKFYLIRQHLYTVIERDRRLSGEKVFDYLNASAHDAQKEMEKAFTLHLKEIKAYLPPYRYQLIDFHSSPAFEQEASIIIPVYNRERTIADAVESALQQETSFPFNVLVVDNHSTDKTSQILKAIAKKDKRLLHLVPESKYLGIGGCWNYAVNHAACGKFAVQLDSDDLYSTPHTLQTIVDTFYREKSAMVIGSYRICNFNLETLPPGLIDHREWSDENGRNNALRINGLGAPRAFYTPVIREIGFPNVSYGEDYAAALAVSRYYRIARIYDELYLCRRWEGNSDAALSPEKVNEHNLYKDTVRSEEIKARRQMIGQGEKPSRNEVKELLKAQLWEWGEIIGRYKSLDRVLTKEDEATSLKIQYNPGRIDSTTADTDEKAIAARPCFLCKENRPELQRSLPTLLGYEVLVNPYPILNEHYTIAYGRHIPQRIENCFADMWALAWRWRDMIIFYNGPHCGASAPDHLHMQAGTKKEIPLIHQMNRYLRYLLPVAPNLYYVDRWVCPLFVIASGTLGESEKAFERLCKSLKCDEGESEPMLSVLCSYNIARKQNITLVFPRSKHRPDCYYERDEKQRRLISPGALDMCGLVVASHKGDFENLTCDAAIRILREVSLNSDEISEVLSKARQ